MQSSNNFSYLLPFIFVVFGCTFLFLARLGSASARYWGLGFISAALGFCTPLILASLPLEANAIVSNAFFLAAHLCYGRALYRRFDVHGRLVRQVALWALTMSVLSYLILVHHDLRTELVVSDIASAVLIAVPLWFVRRKLASPIDKLLAIMAGLVVLDCLARIFGMLVLAGSESYATLDDFLSSDYAFYMQLNASIIGFLLALTVLGALMLDVIMHHRHAAEHDPLTEVLNRRGFERAISDFVKSDFAAGAVIVCDIDHFKLVNDRFGHAAGDTVIHALAAVLKKGLPSGSLIARFGGEEFVAFVPGLSLSEAVALADAIRLDFAARNLGEMGVGQQVTASFGISLTARGDHSMHDAISRADTCLYAAKVAGRNRVVSEGQRAPNAPPSLRLIST